jgi:FkbM family methyltransferase
MTNNRNVELDLFLFSAAAFYNLDEKSGRLRSVADLERFFFRLVGVLDPDLFVEAGAKDATSSRRARAHAPNARIVAFEANPLNYDQYKGNPKNKSLKVEYVHKALSSEEGTLTFNVLMAKGKPATGGQSSILTRTDDLAGAHPVKVESTRLDTFFKAEKAENCCAWVDVEGATQQVLSGMTGILDGTAMIYVEVEDRAIWDGQWLASDVANFLSGHGFTPIARDFQSRYQYNVIYLRNDLLLRDRVRFVLAEHISRVGCRTSLGG